MRFISVDWIKPGDIVETSDSRYIHRATTRETRTQGAVGLLIAQAAVSPEDARQIIDAVIERMAYGASVNDLLVAITLAGRGAQA